MKKSLFFFLYMGLFSTAQCYAQTTLFSQTFDTDLSNTTLLATPNMYVNASTPTNGQFTFMYNSVSGIDINKFTTASVTGGKLVFNRTGGSGVFAKTGAFTGINTLYIEFDLEVPYNLMADVSTASLKIGTGYTNGATLPTNAETYASLTINFADGGNGFQIRDVPTQKNSSTFTSSQRITWVLNNSGASIPYAAPDGSSQILENDKQQVWIGTTKAFSSNYNVITPTQSLSDMKFNFFGQEGIITFDNFLIRSIAGTLPISLSKFEALTQENNEVLLRWATNSEHNAHHFELHRSSNAIDYEQIATVDALGESQTSHTYLFTDKNPITGQSYYQLTEIDQDGSKQHFRPISVYIEPKLVALPNPNDGTLIEIQGIEADDIVEVCNLLGQIIQTKHQTSRDIRQLIPLTPLPQGNYLIRIVQNNTIYVKKLSVR
jgi:Secretion system C-terminal sorting domain